MFKITILLVLFQCVLIRSQLSRELTESGQLLKWPRERKLSWKSEQIAVPRREATAEVRRNPFLEAMKVGATGTHRIFPGQFVAVKKNDDSGFYTQGRFSGRKRSSGKRSFDEETGEEFGDEKQNYSDERKSSFRHVKNEINGQKSRTDAKNGRLTMEGVIQLLTKSNGDEFAQFQRLEQENRR